MRKRSRKVVLIHERARGARRTGRKRLRRKEHTRRQELACQWGKAWCKNESDEICEDRRGHSVYKTVFTDQTS